MFLLSAPLHLLKPDYNIIDRTYDQFGPTPRLCLELAFEPDELEAYQDAVQNELKELTLQNLQELTSKVEKLTMDEISHNICLIRREEIHTVDSPFLVTPITDYIRSGLALSLRNHDMRQLIETYKSFISVPFSRGMAGFIFESICHQRFQDQISIECMPMVRLASDDGRRNPKWHSIHDTFENYELENLREKKLPECTTLDVSPGAHEYNELELAIEPDIYYIPMKSNEVAFDSFICHGDHLYIFQFTVSQEHGINDGLTLRFAECTNFPPRENWRFIFVIPNNVKHFQCPFPKSQALQDLEIFSAQVVVVEESKEPRRKKQKMTEAPAENDGGSKRISKRYKIRR
jgi:hypothetical protein